MSRKILFSALVGRYDEVPEVKYKKEGWEYILFTDQHIFGNYRGWEIKPLAKIIENDSVRTARWHKTHPHILFENCLCSVYIDCNIEINSDYFYTRVEELIESITIIATIKHPFRNCIYKEARECLDIGKDTKSNIDKNLNLLKNSNYPEENGLFETNLFFRNHTFSEIIIFNERWWDIIFNMSRRDQLSMCFVLWELNLKCDYFFHDKDMNVRNTEYFNFIESHKVDNNVIEISVLEYRKLKDNHKKMLKIKRTLSYKLFYKLEKLIIRFIQKVKRRA